MDCMVTKCLPMSIPKTLVKVLGDNRKFVLGRLLFPICFFFVCLLALAQISAPEYCYAEPDFE